MAGRIYAEAKSQSAWRREQSVNTMVTGFFFNAMRFALCPMLYGPAENQPESDSLGKGAISRWTLGDALTDGGRNKLTDKHHAEHGNQDYRNLLPHKLVDRRIEQDADTAGANKTEYG